MSRRSGKFRIGKYLFCMLISLFIYIRGYAQDGAVRYKLEYPKELRAGDSIKLMVTLDVKPGFYIYAPTEMNSAQGMQITQLRFAQLPEGLKRAGSLETPKPAQKGVYQVFTGEGIKFAQTFVASKDMQAGEVVLKGKLISQACNDHICYPPVTEAFEATIHVLK